jgi:hypothetical protein
MGIAFQNKSGIKPSRNINGVVIGYHLVKLNLVAFAVLYQSV